MISCNVLYPRQYIFVSSSVAKIINLIKSTLLVPPGHLLLDSVPKIGPLISRWELDKFKNCWNKSFRTSKILTLLYQQFSNLSISQWYMNGPRLGALSNNRWSGGSIFAHFEFFWSKKTSKRCARHDFRSQYLSCRTRQTSLLYCMLIRDRMASWEYKPNKKQNQCYGRWAERKKFQNFYNSGNLLHRSVPCRDIEWFKM